MKKKRTESAKNPGGRNRSGTGKKADECTNARTNELELELELTRLTVRRRKKEEEEEAEEEKISQISQIYTVFHFFSFLFCSLWCVVLCCVVLWGRGKKAGKGWEKQK